MWQDDKIAESGVTGFIEKQQWVPHNKMERSALQTYHILELCQYFCVDPGASWNHLTLFTCQEVQEDCQHVTEYVQKERLQCMDVGRITWPSALTVHDL